MLTLGSRYLTTGSDRSSGTRSDSLSLKIEQANKDVKWVL